MAKNESKLEDQFQQVEQALTKTEQFIEDNQNVIVKVVVAIVVIIALVFGYNNFYIKPLENEAQTEMYIAENYFQKDSFNLALNGDGQYLGFIDIADEYSLTKAGALANYYAGLSYLHLGNFEEAIDYLKDFSSSDEILSTLALGCIGDAYLELDDSNQALSYYNKAINNSANKFTTPRYMLKKAFILEDNNNFNDALEIYNKIKMDYPDSREGNGIDKYISRSSNR